MALKSVTTKITYKVPAWQYCNLNSHKIGVPSSEKCRFCVKEKGYHRCALYNELLSTEGKDVVLKARACERAVCGFKSVVEDVEEVDNGPSVDPKYLMKTTIQEYLKTKNKLLSQGYPEFVADKVAQQYVLGDK